MELAPDDALDVPAELLAPPKFPDPPRVVELPAAPPASLDVPGLPPVAPFAEFAVPPEVHEMAANASARMEAVSSLQRRRADISRRVL